MKSHRFFVLSLSLGFSIMASCGPTPSTAPTPTASETPSPAGTTAPSARPTATPEATPTPAATAAPTTTPTAVPSASPQASPSPQPSPSPQASPTPATSALPSDAPIEDYRDNFFKNYGINPFVEASTDPLSTFAADVDTASYSITRSFLNQNTKPPTASVRTEEFLNAFNYFYPQPLTGTFAIQTDFAPSYFGDSKTRMLRVGLQGREVLNKDRKQALLTFVIDVSGSMNQENRLDLAKKSLNELVNALQPEDQVALVIYGSQARTVLSHTPVSKRNEIINAINSLRPEGSTNAEAGLSLAYQEASKAFRFGAINRVILCSDGVANVGATGPDKILERIKKESENGITLTTLGFGMNGFNDTLMEQLANQGDGNYAYIDSLEEAKRLLVQQLASTLQVIAKNVKIQVAFNPEAVEQYRLMGYENRDVADDDFRNDAVDAGEVGSNHSVTALYEVRLKPEITQESMVATVNLRYEDVDDNNRVKEINKTVSASSFQAFSNASASFQLSMVVAEFAEILRGSIFARDGKLSEVQQQLQNLQSNYPRPEDLNELSTLLKQAVNIEQGITPEPVKTLEKVVETSENPKKLDDWQTFLIKQLGGV